MKEKKWVKRILPFFLATVLLLSIFPASAAQQEEAVPVPAITSETINPHEDAAIAIDSAEAKDFEVPLIIGETNELRSESVKQFLCDDGTYLLAVYSSPVHYKENGVWRNIDSSLMLSDRAKSVSGEATYVPRASALSVSIPQDFSNGQQVEVSNQGYTFGFRLSAENKNVSLRSAATIVDAEKISSHGCVHEGIIDREQVPECNAEMMALDNLTSAIVYRNVLPDTDVEYEISSDRIKEKITVASPQTEYTYRFDVSMDGLAAVPQDDGSILMTELKNPKNAIFTLEAPYMYDANGEESNDVKMTIENGVLTLTADSAWLNAEDRLFPAVIDPTVIINSSSNYAVPINDTYVSSIFGNSNYINNAKLYAGKTWLGEITRTYVKFSLPQIPDGAQVLYAQFELMKVWTSASSILNVRKLATDWNPSNIKWNTQPIGTAANSANSLPLVDSRNTVSGSDVYRFDITSALKGWYNGSTTGNTNNYGLVITTPNETSTGQVDLYSAETSSAAQRPVLWFGLDLPGSITNPIITGAPQGASTTYTTADAAALAWANYVHSSTYYIRFEFAANIYVNSSGTYYLSATVAGAPHSVSPPSVPSGTTRVAYIHSHPNGNEFSDGDKEYGDYYGINGYVSAPTTYGGTSAFRLLRYNVSNKTTTVVQAISLRSLSSVERITLLAIYQDLWYNHIIPSCVNYGNGGCAARKWPQYL